MKTLERQYKLLKIVNRKRTTTVAELAAELNVSERTILRDISDLSGFLPIRTMQGRYGGGVSYIDDYIYCDYKFYMKEEHQKVLNKIVFEIKTYGFCILTFDEIESVIEIVNKYSKSSYIKSTVFS